MAINRDEDLKFQEMAHALAVQERPRKTRIADSIDEGFDSLDMDPYFARQDDDEDNGDSRSYVMDYSRPGPGFSFDPMERFILPLADAGDGAVNLVLERGQGAATFVRASVATTREKGWSNHPGTAVANVTTPSTTANSVFSAGALDIRIKVASADWTPASPVYLVGKIGAAGSRAYALSIHSSGSLTLVFSLDGTADVSVSSSVATGVTDGVAKWCRVTRDTASGDVRFMLSDDGVVWTQLGTTQSAVPGVIFPANRVVEMGRGGSSELTGKIYYAEIRNGIDGNVVVRYDPYEAATGAPTSWVSSTGETWTAGNGCTIQKLGLKKVASGVARSHYLADGTYGGYLAENVRENLCLQSEDLGTTWANGGGTTPTLATNSEIAPDGTLTADVIGDDDAAAFESKTQSVTVADDSLVHVFSVFIKKTTADAHCCGVNINLSGGVSTGTNFRINTNTGVLTGSGAGLAGSGVEDWGTYWRAWAGVANNGSGNTSLSIGLFPATGPNSGSNPGADVVTATGTKAFWGMQLEKATFPSSYIPTTTVAVTRAADRLTYPLLGNASQSQGACYAEVYNGRSAALGVYVALTSNGYPLYQGATDVATEIRISDGTASTVKTGVSSIETAIRKRASSWGSNGLRITSDGAAVASTSFTGRLGSAVSTQVLIGTTSTVDQPFATIKNVRIWQAQLPDERLQALTA